MECYFHSGLMTTLVQIVILCNTNFLHTIFQVIPLQTILDFHEHRESQYIKQLCMSVYTQCRRTVPHQILGRSLTGFGPAAQAEEMLKTDKNLVCAVLQINNKFLLKSKICNLRFVTRLRG